MNIRILVGFVFILSRVSMKMVRLRNGMGMWWCQTTKKKKNKTHSFRENLEKCEKV